uniref:HC1 n=1 Tax=Homo sapiens TaxID=9606 RepID=Q49KD3_HUMAN|nr:HC1 [Homo sapiens]
MEKHEISLSTMRGYSKKTAICQPGRQPSLDTGSASTFILGFPASTTVRNKCLWLKPLSQ